MAQNIKFLMLLQFFTWKYVTKSFSEIWIEDCVDDRVDTGVDVAKESGDIKCNVARGGVEVVLDTQSIKNVTSEERNPTDQESYWEKKCIKDQHELLIS